MECASVDTRRRLPDIASHTYVTFISGWLYVYGKRTLGECLCIQPPINLLKPCLSALYTYNKYIDDSNDSNGKICSTYENVRGRKGGISGKGKEYVAGEEQEKEGRLVICGKVRMDDRENGYAK